MEQILTSNKFDWLKDGVNKKNEYVFNVDGSYVTSTSKNVNQGTWNIQTENTI